MRLYEIETPRRYSRRPVVSLRTINGWKHRHANLMRAEEKRAPLIAAMYGQPIDHDAAMQAIELEKEKVVLTKEKAELDNVRAKQGEESFKAIQRLSRAAMRQRKN